jgi:diketogulonate reductase-like aldo/keto reductase
VVEFCQAHGIAITAYMPLAYGKVLAEPLLMEIGSATASRRPRCRWPGCWPRA